MYSTNTLLKKPITRRLLVIIFLVAISTACYSLARGLFQIKEIEIVGEKLLVAVDKEKLPKGLLFFPEKQIEEEILKSNPVVKNIDIQKKYPHTIVIVITPRDGVMRIKNENQIVLIDTEGYVLGDGSSSQAPVGEFNFSIPPYGQRIDNPQVQVSILLISTLQSSFPIQYITMHDSKSLRVRLEKTDIFFPHNTDVQTKLATLQTLLTGFRIKSTLPKIIDLRFEKPIVIF